MNENNPSYYSITPAPVRYDPNLDGNAKLLYGEITALSSKEGYCWASNDHFAELYNVSSSTIKRWLSQLINGKYIDRQMIYKENSKEVKSRILRLLPLPIPDEINVSDVGANMNPGVGANMNLPGFKYEPDSIKSINKLNNNNYPAPDDSKILDLWNSVYEKLNTIQERELLKFTQIFSDDVIEDAINKTALARTTNANGSAFGYLLKVLRSWQEANIKTVDEADKFIEGHIQKSTAKITGSKNYQYSRARGKKIEVGTDWDSISKTSVGSEEDLDKLMAKLKAE